MKITEELDTGPVCNIYKIDLEKNLNANDISEKLSLLAAEKILTNIENIYNKKLILKSKILQWLHMQKKFKKSKVK